MKKLNFRNLNLVLIFILPIIFLIFGLKKQNELHEKLMIQGIGIDFIDGLYSLTVHAYDYKNPENKNEPKNKIIECSGKTISESLENLKKITGLYPFYSQNKIIIFGSEVAKMGLNKVLDFFSRYYENRPSVKLRVAKEFAKDIIKFQSDEKPIKPIEIRDLVDEKIDTNILDFEKNTKTEISDPMLMLIEKKESSLLCENICIFKNDQMIKHLDKDESLGVQILKNVPKLGVYTFLIDGNKISCYLENAETKIKPKKDISEFDINIKLTAKILESEKRFESIDQMEKKIKNNLNNKIKEICERSINECISQRSDLFNFGKISRNNNPSYFKSIESSWKNDILPNIKINLKVDSNISMIGLNNE